MSQATASFVSVVTLIIVLAIIGVAVSKRSQLATVINQFSTALDKLLSASTQKVS